MQRCLTLAEKGAGSTAPNPMVGAVLVHDGRIIGEGFHQQYGGPHAEVNCINSVKQDDAHLVSQATMYVSLEPCAHFGKTPPCADLIVRKKIKKVVIGSLDPFSEVNGKGIDKLKSAGLEVIAGILENECKELNRRFFTFHTRHRPYIILKWAQTADEKTGTHGSERLMISNEYTNRLVHRWRSEEAAIMVGTNTALADNPELTTRLWEGASPVRIVVDMDLRLPASLKLFDKKTKTIVFNSVKHEEGESIFYYQVTRDVSLVHQVVHALYQLKIQSLMVEGGTRLLQSFIDEEMWDEARVITSKQLIAHNGLPAPVLSNKKITEEKDIHSDHIVYYRRVE